MSNFLIFKAAFNNSATPTIGTYTAEGAATLFTQSANLSPDYYLYNTEDGTAVQWFVPTAETTDFEFVADILTRNWSDQITYFIIADSTETTRLHMWSKNTKWYFENSDSTVTTESPEFIGSINPATSGGFNKFHQFRIRVRKLTASSSSVEVYVDGALKLTATAEAALITCTKIGFMGGVGAIGPGIYAGVKNAYVYDLSSREVIDRSVLSGAFNRFISWAKNIFATKDNVVLRSGGNIMTGTNLGRPNDAGTLSISGGTTVGGNAGYIKCYGATASTYSGAVEIGGRDIKFIFRNSAIESWAGNQDLGSSGRRFGTAYITALNIDGTFNGINPGALSLPSNSYINIDTTNWDLTCQNGLMGSYTPTADGWLVLQVNNSGTSEVNFWLIGGGIRINNKSTLSTSSNNNFNLITIPVTKGTTYNIFGNASEYVAERKINYCRFMPCQGNV